MDSHRVFYRWFLSFVTVHMYQCDQRCRGRTTRDEPGDDADKCFPATIAKPRHNHSCIHSSIIDGATRQPDAGNWRFLARFRRYCGDFPSVVFQFRQPATERWRRTCRTKTCCVRRSGNGRREELREELTFGVSRLAVLALSHLGFEHDGAWRPYSARSSAYQLPAMSALSALTPPRLRGAGAFEKNWFHRVCLS